ncbi:MAG: gluconolactonase, partial [Halanaerobiales bacterium]
MNRKLNITSVIILTLLIGILCNTYIYASVPYKSYVYNYEREKVQTPAPYIPDRFISGLESGIGSFSTPEDIYLDNNGNIYILDSGNNRLVIMDREYKVNTVIDKFINNGIEDTFNRPE